MTVDLERMQADIRRATIRSSQQDSLISELQARTALLTRQVNSLPTAGAPAITNFIRNGDFGYSFDRFFRAVPVVDDARYECAFIYTHDAPTAGQQLKEDSVYSGSLVAASTALPSNERSDTPTVDPWWLRTAGHAEIGSTRTLDFPLPSNEICFPGRKLYVGMLLAKKSADVTVPGRLYAGIWDNTAGQRDFITGDGFPLEAEVVGIPATTVSREYLVVLTSDFRKTIKSSTVTVVAPADAAFVSGQVYVKLSWPKYAGFIQTDIYRKTAGVYVLLARQSVATQFFDQGDIQQSVGSYPNTDDTQQRAFVATRPGFLDSYPIDGVDPAWQTLFLGIEIPKSYNQGLTTDKLWMRVGFDEALTGTDAAHGMFLDLASFSPDVGNFAPNKGDQDAKNTPDAAPNGSSQGGGGTGGGGFEPPNPGEGRCIMGSASVWIADDNLRPQGISADELLRNWVGKRILSAEVNRLCLSEIENIEDGHVELMYRIATKAGIVLRCTETHRLITNFGDEHGTQVRRLQRGDPVISFDAKKGCLFQDEIVSRSVRRQRTRIIKISLRQNGPPYYIAGDSGGGGLLSHNDKPLEAP